MVEVTVDDDEVKVEGEVKVLKTQAVRVRVLGCFWCENKNNKEERKKGGGNGAKA